MGCLRGLLSLVVIVLIVSVVAAVFGNKQSNGTLNTATRPAVSSPAVTEPEPAPKPYTERMAELRTTLDQHDFTRSLDDADDIAVALASLDLFAIALQEEPDSDEGRKAQADHAEKLRAIQKRVLPILRDKYGPALRKELWEADGKARTIGTGFRTVEFIAAIFAANRNIKSTFETMYPSLMKLRFTQARFRWFDGASEYTYYTLTPPPDDAIVIWSKGGGFTQIWPRPKADN